MDKSKKSQWLTRYEKQFEFARQVWEDSTGQKYTGSPREVIEIEHKIRAKELKIDENKNPFCLPHILMNLEAIGALIAIPIIINVIGKVANESCSIICEVIIPPSKTTAIGGNAATVEDKQITMKFLLIIPIEIN